MRWFLPHRTPKSVTYVLNQLCYLCSEPGPNGAPHAVNRTQFTRPGRRGDRGGNAERVLIGWPLEL